MVQKAQKMGQRSSQAAHPLLHISEIYEEITYHSVERKPCFLLCPAIAVL